MQKDGWCVAAFNYMHMGGGGRERCTQSDHTPHKEFTTTPHFFLLLWVVGKHVVPESGRRSIMNIFINRWHQKADEHFWGLVK